MERDGHAQWSYLPLLLSQTDLSSVTAELLLLQIILTEKKNVVDFCLLSSLTTTKNVLIFICIRYIDSNLNLKEIYFLTQNNEVHIFW